MTIDQYLAWVSERLPKDIPSEIVTKSLNIGLYVSGLQLWTYGERGPDTVVFTASHENELKHWLYRENKDYIYNAIHDSRKYWMEYHLSLLRRVLSEEEVSDKIMEYESLINMWFTEKHWSFDREQFRFVEISDSKMHDTYGIEEPREGSII